MPFIATNCEQYAGQVVGSGHCVALVREASGAPHTSKWRRGDPVLGSLVAPGTAIATFEPNGRYGNHTDGRSHAAILVEDLGSALLVWDQWLGRATRQRTIRDKRGEGSAVDDASRYHLIVVEQPEIA